MFRFYYECVRLLKKRYTNEPEKCPFADFGQDTSNISLI